MQQGVRLFVGGHAGSIQGESYALGGDRMYSAVHGVNAIHYVKGQEADIDSGAFSDDIPDRLTFDAALARQLDLEQSASNLWGFSWRARALVSYDVLIDETWVAGERHKRRWSVKDADWAVCETVAAAAYLAEQRAALTPRRLVLSCQGVDALQYAECAAGVLRYAQPNDIFGLGGWCILGRFTSFMPTFWATIRFVLPMVAHAGIKDVHIFGVLHLPALGGLLWLADQYKLNVSTDSTAPALSCTRSNPKKAGVRMKYWRNNVIWWKTTLRYLRNTQYYKEPPKIQPMRQETFL